jgi:membrane-bound acyltransferase YfiQ involved in biofilm formation
MDEVGKIIHEIFVENFIGPLIVMVIVVGLFWIIGSLIYYSLLRSFIPEKIMRVVGLLFSVFIIYYLSDHTEQVKSVASVLTSLIP